MLKTITHPGTIIAKFPIVTTVPAQLRQSIFHEPWWLDITSGGSYREAVVSSGGHIVGRLPYRIWKTKSGFTVLDMPRLVHALGPAIAPQFAGKNFPRSLKEFSIISDLIAQLPKASHISFRLHSGITNTLAFEAAGFTSSPNFTVEIEPAPIQILWSQMRDKTRNVVRRAQECLKITTVTDVDLFLDFYELNLKQKGHRNEYLRPVCSCLLTETLQRGAGRIIAASDTSGVMQCAVFTVWDSRAEYYFMATRSRKAMNGANCLLIWEALQHASSQNLIFDMDGIHVVRGSVPNLLLLTGFGGCIKPRYQVQRSCNSLLVARCLRELWRE